MAQNRVGSQTIRLQNPPKIISTYSTVGPVEGKGPLATYFHDVLSDPMLGEPTPEKAERKILEQTVQKVLAQQKLATDDIQYFIAGDLLNQIITANFSARSLGVPLIGIFSACATFAEGIGLGSMLIDGNYADKVLVGVSSHYQTAERQYRYPIELNIQRKLTNQTTVTGAGALVLSREGEGPRVTHITFGKVVDMGIKDVNDMGSAMAPAAMDTLIRHLEDTGQTPGDYDLILTGDLASQGSKMLRVLTKEKGLSLGEKLHDAGAMIFGPQQSVGAGGSGAACSAVVTTGYVMKEIFQGKYRRVLLVATGALMNSLTYQQGESIPCIAHSVTIEI